VYQTLGLKIHRSLLFGVSSIKFHHWRTSDAVTNWKQRDLRAVVGSASVRVGGRQNEPCTVSDSEDHTTGFWGTASSTWVQTLLLPCAGQKRNCSGENWEVRTWNEREMCNRMGACWPEKVCLKGR